MTDETDERALIDALEARGYTVERKDTDLGEKVAGLEDKLASLTAKPPTPEQAVAEELRTRLNASLTPWLTLGGNDAA
jgi:hypothetical protein